LNGIIQFESLLLKAIDASGLPIPEGTIPLLLKHYELLRKWDSIFNLTSLDEPEDIIDRLYIDSLLFLQDLRGIPSLLDIGSGSGFPGIPLLAANPQLTLTILEPKRKMCAFLSEVKYTFKNERNFEIINARCDSPEFIKPNKGRFPVIISKAFKPPANALQLILPIIKPDGLYATCINPGTPLNAAIHAGYELYTDNICILPLTGKITRHIIFKRKNSPSTSI
jgi:16S rRNA (guanine527-N7)-methyltransferase